MRNAVMLTVDVEDWFQVENFKEYIRFDQWSSFSPRVETNTRRLLDFLDQPPGFPAEGGCPRATFFVLGWIAEKFPGLIREIHNRGHEVASHGFNHNLCYREPRKALTEDLKKSRALLEDLTGAAVTGYRAPSFSIDDSILKRIEDCGYGYDSSYNSFDMHGRYGRATFAGKPKRGIAVRMSPRFFELPVSNFSARGKVLPWGGGGYFRLIPLSLFKIGVRKILEKESAYLFYMHPWEIDPGQPRVTQASVFFKFRHYVNLDKTQQKLAGLMQAFSESRFITCRDYIQSVVT